MSAAGTLGALRRLHATVRWLKPVQVSNRITRTLWVPRLAAVSGARRRAPAGTWQAPVPAPASWIAPDRMRFLGVERDIAGPQIWNDQSCERLWRYHLHYFRDLTAADATARRDWHRAWIARWVRENPPIDGTGWEPFPISQRTVSWIKWALAGEVLDHEILDSLATQLRWLRRRIEYHLLGNHLFENGRGLFMGGCFFAGAEAGEWQALGHHLLEREIREQVLGDGGHFELSPMYHALVLEGLLDTLNVAATYGVEPPAGAPEAAARMLDWLDAMSHPDGRIALLNDAAFDEAPTPASLRAYARRLGLPETRFSPASMLLADSGYARLVSGPLTVIADAAPIGPDYLPGHAHADTLSFEMSVGTRRVIVDSGTSTYAIGPERDRQRGTLAHNTVAVDGCNSSDVWAGFRVGQRARVLDRRFESASDGCVLEASHDGYLRLGVVHRRVWHLSGGQLRILDRLEGGGERRVTALLHFHPAVRVRLADAGRAVLECSERERIGQLVLDPALVWRLESSTYHARFGASESAQRLVGEARLTLPAQLETAFSTA